MKWYGWIAATMILAALQGCGIATIAQSVPTDYEPTEASETGLLLMSLSYDGGYAGYSVYFQSLDGDLKKRATIGVVERGKPPRQRDWDIEVPGTRGKVFAIELPAGQYEFYRLMLSTGVGSGTLEPDIPIPFEIQPGQSTYMGAFRFVVSGRIALNVNSVFVVHQDYADRDLPLMVVKYPNIETARISRGIEERHHEVLRRSQTEN
jgi:hypothetical protein